MYNDDYDEDYEELDDVFLSGYNATHKTHGLGQFLRDDEDEDKDDLFYLEKELEDDQERQRELMLKSVVKTTRKPVEIYKAEDDMPNIRDTKDIKSEKRHRVAGTFKRHALKKSGDMHERKRLTYYLTPDNASLLKVFSKTSHVKRRDLVISALKKLLETDKITINHSTTAQNKTGKKVFIFDEVPCDLWDQIHDVCSNAHYKHYEIVEEALRQEGILV